MSDNAGAKGPEPSERVAIGITFGNSNSSVAYTVDDKAEVIANEDGGMLQNSILLWICAPWNC
jgi:molecular chaperone DnaK (HSP70)